MVEKLHPVGIGEIVVSADIEKVLVAYGLGSCVAICLYDPLVQVGGMLHALLPTPVGSRHNSGAPAKFVELGVPALIRELVASGAVSFRLKTYLCGGASVLATSVDDPPDVGQRNIQAATKALHDAGLKIQGQAVGGQAGRTVKLYVATGHVMVRSLGQPEQLLKNSRL
jgi:chemotaxis protein CheD